jgi:hypothetical protein
VASRCSMDEFSFYGVDMCIVRYLPVGPANLRILRDLLFPLCFDMRTASLRYQIRENQRFVQSSILNHMGLAGGCCINGI